MELSEQTLIDRVIKSDDRHAYSTLVRRYQSQIRQSLRHWCKGDHALADDLAQETFLKAYRALPGFRSDARFSSWLYRIAYNVMISHFRKQPLETAEESLEITDERNSFAALDAKRDIRAAMAQLSQEQQNAVHLCLELGFSHQEAADIMSMPLGTVKTNVLRGKERLQSLLSSWQNEVTHAPTR